MTYPLCHQTVTVYHREGQQIIRKVAENCYYHWQDQKLVDAEGVRLDRKFLLILPGDTQGVFPGDRIYDGEGPEVSLGQWAEFLPVLVPGLSEAAYAICHSFDGRICHTEAGRK